MFNNFFPKLLLNNNNAHNMINVGKKIASSNFNNFNNFNHFCNRQIINVENNNYKKMISFFFLLSTGQKYKYSAQPKDLFKKVLQEFISENLFLKNKIECIICNANIVDQIKTLSENGISENSIVFLKVSDLINMDPFIFNALNNNSTSTTNKSKLISLDDDDMKLILNIKD